MTWRNTEAFVIPQAIEDTSTTKNVPLGTVVRAVDDENSYGAGEFIYLQGVGSTVAGSWVTYDVDGATALLAADAVGHVAVAMSANVANQYGWYAIKGKVPAVATSVSMADNADIYASATSGEITAVVTTGDRVWGAETRAAADTDGLALVEINRPFTTDAVNSGTS